MSTAAASEDKKKGGHGMLTLWIVLAIVGAIVLAMVAPQVAVYFALGGEIFLRLLQMVVVPLVMASVMSGILGLGDVRKLGKPGAYAVLYYVSTTVLAVATGLIVVNIVNPGVGINPKLVMDAQREGAETVAKAQNAMEHEHRPVTWGEKSIATQSANGTSNPIALYASDRPELVVSFEQTSRANSPARVMVEISRGEDRFEAFGEPLEAPLGPETSRWTVSPPPDAKRLRLKLVVGDATGVLRAEVIRGPPGIADIFSNLVLMLFTDNLLGSMVHMNLLPIIVFSIVFAGMLTTMGKRSQVIADLVHSINDAMMNFVMLLMRLAPLGIFCLVTARFGKAITEGQFLELMQVLAGYMIAVLTGLGVHALITLPLLLWIFTRRNPFRFMGQMSQAVLTAFSTASSTATLPVTMECAETRAGVSKRSTEFVLPLGATINMDGTALYEAAAAIFIAQAYHTVFPDQFELGLMQQLTIAVTATLAAIGAAGIPEAGLVTMLIVLNAVGLPLELIALIIPVDWLLDRFRTAVNAFGDSVGAAIVDKSFPQDP